MGCPMSSPLTNSHEVTQPSRDDMAGVLWMRVRNFTTAVALHMTRRQRRVGPRTAIRVNRRGGRAPTFKYQIYRYTHLLTRITSPSAVVSSTNRTTDIPLYIDGVLPGLVCYVRTCTTVDADLCLNL